MAVIIRSMGATCSASRKPPFQQLAEEPAPDDWEAQWEAEHRQRLFSWASEKVQSEVEPRTWQAFRLTAVEGRPGKEVAQELNMTVAAVYLAKSRVMARLKELVREAEVSDETNV